MAQTQYNSDKDYDLTVVGNLTVGGSTTWTGDHTINKATPVLELHSNTDTIAEVVVDGGDTTDSTVRFQNNNVNKWTLGNDGDSSDAFVIAASGALGNTNAASIANSGVASTWSGNMTITRATPWLEVASSTDTLAEVVVDGGATTDSTVRFQNSNVNKWTVGNDGDALAADAFVIANSGALGTTNALSIADSTQAATFSGNVSIASAKSLSSAGGAANFDWSSSSGTFDTSTGVNTLRGSVTLAANKNVSVTAGTSAVDFSNGTGVFKTTTGAVTIGTGAITFTGAVTANENITGAAGAKTLDLSAWTGNFKSPTGTATLNGDNNIAAGKSISFLAGAGSFDAQNATGTTDTTTGANTLRGNVTIAGAKTFTTGTGAVAINGSATVATGKTLTLTDDFSLIINGTTVTSTAAEIVRVTKSSSRVNNETTAARTMTIATDESKILTLDKAAGIAVILPATTGSGNRYTVIVKTTAGGGNYTLTRAGADTIYGFAIGVDDDAVPSSGKIWIASGSTVITLNGTTQGGYAGDRIELIDYEAGRWQVTAFLKQTGVEATPFS